MFKFNLPIFTLSLLLILASGPRAFAQTQPPPEQQPQQAPQEPYQESALRRFEIITLSSLPFTVVHSYLVVRGVKMYRESQFAPELSPQDYRMIGIGAVSLSLFIGGWDWWQTRNVDSAAPRFQEREPPPEEEEQPEEGPGEEQIARLPRLNPPGFIGYSTNTVGAVSNRAPRLNPPGFIGSPTNTVGAVSNRAPRANPPGFIGYSTNTVGAVSNRAPRANPPGFIGYSTNTVGAVSNRAPRANPPGFIGYSTNTVGAVSNRAPRANPPGFIGYSTNTVGAVSNRAPRANPPGFIGGIGEVPSHNVLNRWANEPAAGIAVPLLLIRF